MNTLGISENLINFRVAGVPGLEGVFRFEIEIKNKKGRVASGSQVFTPDQVKNIP